MKRLISILVLLFSLSCVNVIAEEPTLTTPYGEEVRWDVAGAIIYIGWARPGTATSVSEWKIARMTYTGDDWVLEYADDDILYDNEYDERAISVSY